jgi:hypothetical protein
VPSKYTPDFLWVLYDKEQAGCCGQQILPSKHAIYNPLFDVKDRECHWNVEDCERIVALGCWADFVAIKSKKSNQ